MGITIEETGARANCHAVLSGWWDCAVSLGAAGGDHLSLGGDLADDAQLHTGGLRASDRGFSNIPLSDYLRLLRWTAKQGSGEVAAKVPRALAGTLTALGIDASMWRDLVWNWQRYFGKSTCAGRPESLQADAEKRGRRWHRGQRYRRRLLCQLSSRRRHIRASSSQKR